MMYFMGKLLQILSLLFFVLWAIGVGMFTFDSPYTITNNGYFATWACFLASANLFFQMWTPVSSNSLSQGYVGPLVGSIVVLAQSSLDCSRINKVAASLPSAVPSSLITRCEDTNVLIACIVGSVSSAICLYILLQTHRSFANVGLHSRALATFSFLIWIGGAGVLTFDGPYVLTGNAYFAIWGSFICSGLWFFDHWGAVIRERVIRSAASGAPPKSQGSEFCTGCGQKLSGGAFCVSCGKQHVNVV